MRVKLLLLLLYGLGTTPLEPQEPLQLTRWHSPPTRTPSTLERFGRFFIRFYQRWITPANGPTCNFYPTCSAYALEALGQHGFWGIPMGAERIMRDHSQIHLYPLIQVHGTTRLYDPVEAHAPGERRKPLPSFFFLPETGRIP